MKLTVILLTAAFLNLSAKGVSQNVSFSGKNVSLVKIFEVVEQQTGFVALYTDPILRGTKLVSIEANNVSLDQFLTWILKDQPVEHTIKNKTIFISRRPVVSPPSTPKGDIYQPLAEKITGTILHAETKIPLEGATVTVQGTRNSTVSDNNGRFTILANMGDNLVVSYVGFLSKEYRVSSADLGSLLLEPSTSKLDEVKIIAYGTTTQRKSTGNVSKVAAEEISRQPITNPLAALQGRVAGLFITQTTGVPGGAFNVQIRGQNSIANGSTPYFIVDGVPFSTTPLSSTLDIGAAVSISPFNSLNPADIESIEVLKDADATAIYGSNGANGVIIITTKRGKAGKTKVDINLYSGAGKIVPNMDFLNTQQYLEMRREAFQNDGETSGESDYDLNSWDPAKYTDWQKALIGGTARMNDAQVAISGGTTTTQFLFGGGYHKETTAFPGNFADQKGSANFNINHSSVDQRFKAMFSARYVSGRNNLPRIDVTRYSNLAPNAPDMIKPNGDMNFEQGIAANPFSQFLQKYKATPENLTSSALLSYQVLTNLQIRISAGYNKLQLDELTTVPLPSLHPDFGYTSGFSIFANGKTNSWILEPQAEYTATIGGGKLNALVGTTIRKDQTQGETLLADIFSTDALLENIAAAGDIFPFSSNYSIYKYNAIFGRLKYDYAGKYLINLTARRDGSSRFGPGRQFANFGSVGMGWIFSSEDFAKSQLPFLSFGKLRGSYGSTGNDQIGDYRYLNLYQTTFRSYEGIIGLFPTRLYNPDFGWETNKKLEAALELGFIQNRLLFTASWYRNRSSSQLLKYQLPPTTGFSDIQLNLPATVQNTGWELELNSNNINRRNFKWTTSFNITIPQNKLLAFPGLANSSYANTYEVGKSLNIVKAFHSTGVDPASGNYQFEDVNKNNSITRPADLQAIKKIGQQFYGGLQNGLTYKGWQLDIFFQFVKQTGRNYLSVFDPPGTFGNQPDYVVDRWQKSGDRKPVQKYTQNTGSDAYLAYTTSAEYGDNTVSNASFVRLKNVAISYNLPNGIAQKLKMQSGRIYVQGQNLLTFTNYMGYDPETQTSSMPPLRMITAGIQFIL